MKLPIYQVDAFAGKLFGGNPAAVVILDDWLPDEILQAIGTENNLSETAFVIPRGDKYPLRWCTPTAEVDLCGHATLAAAFILFKEGLVDGDSIMFETRSGVLTVNKSGDMLGMDFPARPPVLSECTDEVVEALGARPREVHIEECLMAVFETEHEVASLRPDIGRVAALDASGVIATAPGREADFVSRFFAPKLGIPEDPVTGSAHCILTPFWADRLNKKKLRALQISKRGGELICEDRGERIIISGRAVEYMRGEIVID